MIDEAHPRARLYALLGRLLLDELDRPLALYLRGLPGLAEHIPPQAELAGWLDNLRAEHQRLFGLNVYPYESIFRDRELLLNTAATQRVAALYAACGFTPAARLRAGAPDHLGVELALMAELHARAPYDTAARAQLARLLRDHLAAWLPACAEALAWVGRAPLYRTVAEIAVDLVLSDLAEFAPHPQPFSHQGRGELQEQEHPNLPLSLAWEISEARRAGWPGGEGLPASEGLELRQIAHRLLTPDHAGAFISRADISAIGHALALPAPIAEREQMLRGLFGAAGQFDLVPALLGALADRLRAADATYARLAAEHPAWADYGRAWRTRVAAGLELLERMGREQRMIRSQVE
jgi:TorA maturation chaperone TorD